MKKTLFFLSIAVAASSIALVILIIHYSPSVTSGKRAARLTQITFPSNGYTLNGVQATDADKMVANFLNDNTISDTKLSAWVSKAWIDNIYKILITEKAANPAVDGFRVYFAKRQILGPAGATIMKNTLVIVSTTTGALNPNAQTGNNHDDYFTHSSPFLTLSGNPDAPLNEEWGSRAGALLSLPTAPTFPGGAAGCTIAPINPIKCVDAYNAVQDFSKSNTINTYCEWFSLDVLEYIEDQLTAAVAAQPKPVDLTGYGLRIYFAKKANRTSLIFVTTRTGQDPVAGITREDDYNTYKSAALTALSGKKGAPTDNGEQCPYNCDDVTVP